MTGKHTSTVLPSQTILEATGVCENSGCLRNFKVKIACSIYGFEGNTAGGWGFCGLHLCACLNSAYVLALVAVSFFVLGLDNSDILGQRMIDLLADS